MKLSLLLLSAVLALSSASLQEIIQKSSQKNKTGTVPFLNPDRGNKIPKITSNRSTSAPLTPSYHDLRLNRSSTPVFSGTTLEWQTWPGYVPAGAFYIYNSYASRFEYVCKYGCESGFHVPSMGSYCYYPFAGQEMVTSTFDILVNKENFEYLEFRPGSHGSVPFNSIRNCYSQNKYVGMNEYGLGKVHAEHECFYLPWEGDEYWYSTYDVLTLNKNNVIREHMSDVRYNLNVGTVAHPPEMVAKSTITNKECREVVKTIQLTEMFQEERRWDSSVSTTIGVSSTITAGIPFISATIGISAETTEDFSSGKTVVEMKTYSVMLEVTVPPNHSCTAMLVGSSYSAEIPFTARIRRTYNTGETRTASVTGLYHGVSIGDVQSFVDRCQPLADAEPCP